MALMAATGEFAPMPKFAVFADTGAEPQTVYTWLEWLRKHLPFPVHTVTAGNLEKKVLQMHVTKDGRKFSTCSIPNFTLSSANKVGKIIKRGCTRDFKIKPIRKFVRGEAEIKRGQKTVSVIQWIGISLDEVWRMKESRDVWQENRWPLIEKRMSRTDCLRWMEDHHFPEPPRSACVFCPFHDDREWRRLKTFEPAEFIKAVKFEQDLQVAKATSDNFHSTPFLHRKCVPLVEIDWSTEEERGQGSLWNNECEGMCGV
jgi:hypothetical protein